MINIRSMYKVSSLDTISKLLWVLLLLSVGLFAFVEMYPREKDYKIEKINVAKYYYNGSSLGDDGRRVVEKKINPTKKADISCCFKFKIPDKGIVSDYENIFQTADINSGLRMEVAKDGVVGLLFNNRTGNRNELTSININELTDIVRGVYHNVEIKIDKGVLLTVNIDGHTVAKELNPNSVEISRILVGQGFDTTRRFSGEIKDFEFKSACYYETSDAYGKLWRQMGKNAVILIMLLVVIISFIAYKAIDIKGTLIRSIISFTFIYCVVNLYKYYISHLGVTYIQHLTNTCIAGAGILLSMIIGIIDKGKVRWGVAIIMSFAILYNALTTGYAGTSIFIMILMILYLIIERYGVDIRWYALIYGVVGVVLNGPNLYNKISINIYYAVVGVAIVLILIWGIYSRKSNEVNICMYGYMERVVLYTIIVLMIFGASVFGFVWDDLNGYLWVPKVSVLKDHSVVGVQLPATLTFYSLHVLAYLTAFNWMFNSYELIDKIFIWKYYNAWLYIVALLLFYKYIRRYVIDAGYIMMILLLLALVPVYMYGEITGNQNDYPLVVSTLIVIAYILSKKAIDHFDIMIFGSLLAISPKSFVVLGPYVITQVIFDKDLIRRALRKEYLLGGLVAVVMICPIYIRNYILTGNPKFPAGNDIIKSPLFDTHGIVADMYRISGGVSVYQYIDLIINNINGIGQYYVADLRFYGPTVILVMITVLYIMLDKHFYKMGEMTCVLVKIEIIQLFMISVLGYLFCKAFIGLQHRYMYSVITTISVLIVILLVGYVKGQPNSVVTRIVLLVCVLYMPIMLLAPNISGEYLVKNRFIVGSEDRWVARYEFYKKMNSVIGINDGVIMYYVQDKIFIKSSNLYELDWYDYIFQKRVIDEINKIDHRDIDKARYEAYEILKKNNISWLLLTKKHDPFGLDIRKNMTKVVAGPDLDLYRIP